MKIKKIVVLGIDGLDFTLTSNYLGQNKLPNLAKIKNNGSFYKLKTTTPPQSPVAWSSFITGAKPEKHGVFDFIKRDRKTYLPRLVFSPNAKKTILKTTPFWKKTSKKNVKSKVLFLPVTFPAPKINGRIISGMGTPDILGTEGTFTLFTSSKKTLQKFRGQRIKIPQKKTINTNILGPKYRTYKGVENSTLPLKIEVTNKDRIKITTNSQTANIKRGTFSKWIELKFTIPPFKKIFGIAKFYLQSLEPEINIYLSPINIHPQKQHYQITYPKQFGQKIIQKHGPFSTLGLPHDTWAFQENIFNTKAFLRQTDQLLQERRKIIFSEFKNFKKGLFVAYFGTTDSIQHMFFSDLIKKNKHKDIIPHYYQQLDKIVGRFIEKIDKNTLLIILSDHGFTYFDWEVNLNTWLKKEGFLQLKKEHKGKELLENINWSKTKAYSVGFNSIYLNLRDRESSGIVPAESKEKLTKKIITELKNLKHNNNSVVKNAYSINSKHDSPDIIVGFSKGYRASWEGAVGATPRSVFKKRNKKWSGDHLFDPVEVPGVLFSNHKLPFKSPAIWQIMPYILNNL